MKHFHNTLTIPLNYLLIWTFISVGCIKTVAAIESDNHNDVREKIIVGGDYDYKPFTYLDDMGEAKGFDVDILKSIAHKYNLELEFRFTSWDQALKNLEDGKVDLLLSVLYTESRDTIFDYTIPYNEDYYGIFVRKDSEVNEISDLSQKQIITLEGDASITRFIKPMALLTNTTLVESLPEAIRLLSEGEGDAVLAPYSIGMEAIENLQSQNVQVVGPSIMPILYRFAVKKGDSQLLSLLNDGIDHVKVSGKREQLIEKWDFHKRDDVSLKTVVRYVGMGLIPLLLVIALLLLWTKALRRSVAKQTQILKERTETLEELNATKDKFFSVIAHDLKSPFTSILGLSELMLKDNTHYDTAQSKQMIRHIHNSAGNTLTLVENLLSWAQSQTGQMKFDPEPVGLKESVDEVVGVLGPSAKVKTISLDNTQIPDITIHADINMLKSILYNLISNAIKFTHANGKVEILAKTREDQVQVVVSDNGVGMDRQTKSKLFHTDSGTTKGTNSEEGSGLGLLICKDFVEKHGGNIWVESELGNGSHFYFTIPLRN